jgi:hypothetical protein
MDSRLSTCLPQPRATVQALALSAGGQTWPRSVRSAGPSYDSSVLSLRSLSRFPGLGERCDLIVNSQFNLSVVGIC